MRIGLASPSVATSIDDGLDKVKRLLADAAIGLLARRYVPDRYRDTEGDAHPRGSRSAQGCSEM